MQEGSPRKKKRNERDHDSGVNKVRAVMWSIKMRYSSSEMKKRERERTRGGKTLERTAKRQFVRNERVSRLVYTSW